MDRMTFTARGPARWVYEKRRLIHSRALPKWRWNIPRQLPGESMVGETKIQEPRFRVSSHSLQPPYVFSFVCLLIPLLINCKTPEGRGSFPFLPPPAKLCWVALRRRVTVWPKFISLSRSLSATGLWRGWADQQWQKWWRGIKPGIMMITHLWSSYLYSTLMSTKEKGD